MPRRSCYRRKCEGPLRGSAGPDSGVIVVVSGAVSTVSKWMDKGCHCLLLRQIQHSSARTFVLFCFPPRQVIKATLDKQSGASHWTSIQTLASVAGMADVALEVEPDVDEEVNVLAGPLLPGF